MTDRLIAWLHEGVDLLGDWLRDAPQSRLEPATDDFGTPPPSVLNPATRRAVEALQDQLIASQLAPPPKPKRKRGRPRIYEPRVPIRPAYGDSLFPCCLGATHHAPGCAAEHRSIVTTAHEIMKEEPPTDAQTYHCSHCGRILPATVKPFHEPNCAAAEKGYTTHESRKPDGSSTL